MELNKETAEIFIDALEKQGKFMDFISGLAKSRQNDLVRAIGAVVGAERMQGLLTDDSGSSYSDPIAAAIKNKNVDLARMLIDVSGTVPHKVSNFSPIRDSSRPGAGKYTGPREDPVPTLTCKALQEALGLGFASVNPDQAQTSFKPDVPMVKMVLEALPEVHPETFLFQPVHQPYDFGQSAERNVSLMSLAIISRNEELIQLMLDRDPVFIKLDLMFAIHMGNADVAILIVEKMGEFPARALRQLGMLDASGQRKLVDAMRGAEKDDGRFELPSLERFAAESVLLINEKADVSLDKLLLSAASAGNAAAVRAVLDAGADPTKEQVLGGGYAERVTPLHEARGVEVVRMLLEAGADPNAEDSKGQPVIVRWLQRTTSYNSSSTAMPGMIAALVSAGADMAIKHGGRSLLQHAGKWDDDVRRTIRSAQTGARVESAFSDDDTPSGPSSSPSGGMKPL